MPDITVLRQNIKEFRPRGYKFILLINVKMPTIVGIFTFISIIYTFYENLKTRIVFILKYFSCYELLKFSVELGTKKVL